MIKSTVKTILIFLRELHFNPRPLSGCAVHTHLRPVQQCAEQIILFRLIKQFFQRAFDSLLPATDDALMILGGRGNIRLCLPFTISFIIPSSFIPTLAGPDPVCCRSVSCLQSVSAYITGICMHRRYISPENQNTRKKCNGFKGGSLKNG